jgi:hypothetical protein
VESDEKVLKIKKNELIKVIQDLQKELRPLLNDGRRWGWCPNDKPWLENLAYVQADAFVAELNGHQHCWQKGHYSCLMCCECQPFYGKGLAEAIKNG